MSTQRASEGLNRTPRIHCYESRARIQIDKTRGGNSEEKPLEAGQPAQEIRDASTPIPRWWCLRYQPMRKKEHSVEEGHDKKAAGSSIEHEGGLRRAERVSVAKLIAGHDSVEELSSVRGERKSRKRREIQGVQ